MRNFLLVLIATMGLGAHADILVCHFTEPFYTLTYSMTQSKLTLESPEQKSEIAKVSFQIAGAGDFELRDRNGAVAVKLLLNGAGSDGMSDAVYPYDATWVANGNLRGGCTSNFLPATTAQP